MKQESKVTQMLTVGFVREKFTMNNLHKYKNIYK